VPNTFVWRNEALGKLPYHQVHALVQELQDPARSTHVGKYDHSMTLPFYKNPREKPRLYLSFQESETYGQGEKEFALGLP
jgi:hypothetical protein